MQKICVRHVSSGTPGGQATTLLDIGGVTDQFKSTTTTAAMDTVPTAFKFTDRVNVEHAVTIVSNALIIGGFNKSTPISVANGEYSIGCNGVFTASAATISPGEKVCVRHVSASQPGTWTDTTLTIGGIADTFSSTTRNGPPNTQP
jgi:hypothetical protein